jgi:hypothetical protein
MKICAKWVYRFLDIIHQEGGVIEIKHYYALRRAPELQEIAGGKVGRDGWNVYGGMRTNPGFVDADRVSK